METIRLGRTGIVVNRPGCGQNLYPVRGLRVSRSTGHTPLAILSNCCKAPRIFIDR